MRPYIPGSSFFAIIPDYIDYQPQGCIVRKIGVMGYIPKPDANLSALITMSREKFRFFADNTIQPVADKFGQMGLVQ